MTKGDIDNVVLIDGSSVQSPLPPPLPKWFIVREHLLYSPNPFPFHSQISSPPSSSTSATATRLYSPSNRTRHAGATISNALRWLNHRTLERLPLPPLPFVHLLNKRRHTGSTFSNVLGALAGSTSRTNNVPQLHILERFGMSQALYPFTGPQPPWLTFRTNAALRRYYRGYFGIA
ncbi:hypothetical protein M407DRAFT_22920 [Tulasnella calospora MUT 4182]|uniref:Uncharacterized protein n=1 Tax=Tulasnella calospora MUT 4182 TaxID=1051891 RepID=A0A0C3M2G2_9AGAM|nr:hypothetical protein M407DRAFT_22920 [Tulasnella calospora MUT 4182]